MAKRKFSRKKSKKKASSGGVKYIRIILIILILIIALGYLSYRGWNSKQTTDLQSSSTVINTSKGPIEYFSKGEGQIILLSHMEGSGADNIKLFDGFTASGYRIICPSRPGYLNTPLNENADYAQQADLFAELLQMLNINEKVVVVGVSAGGPPAIEFTKKYPGKSKALILINAAINQIDSTANLANAMRLKSIPLLDEKSDIASWLVYYLAKYNTRNFIASLLEKNSKYAPADREMKVAELVNVAGAKEDLLSYLECISIYSKRSEGLKNDLSNLSTYKTGTGKIRIPMLIIHSKTDNVIEFSDVEKFKKNADNAELYSYEGNGHAIWLEEDLKNITAKTIDFIKNSKEAIPYDIGLTGTTWVNKSNGALLLIKSDGNFNLDFPSVDSKKFYEGKVIVVDDQISFTYNQGNETCANIAGTYKFILADDNLELKALNDDCKTRKQHFTRGWFKID
ncbi:MAG: alpha/beta hydrolase [Bacteroidetes bacterium]|nr:alpha/beta hydrolase [Bacteroidota bacterium]